MDRDGCAWGHMQLTSCGRGRERACLRTSAPCRAHTSKINPLFLSHFAVYNFPLNPVILIILGGRKMLISSFER